MTATTIAMIESSEPGGGPGGRCPTPRRPVPPPSAGALGLLRQAEVGLAEAATLGDPCRRYAAAHLAALRAGAAVLAVRARPAPRRGRRSVWHLLPAVAPELVEWAAFFEAASPVRAAAEAGITRLVTERAADDLVRQARLFLGVSRSLVVSR
jgi:hypothetical protein